MTLLQFGWEYPDSIEAFLKDLLAVYTNVIPIEGLAMFVFGGLAMASFIRQDSPIIPLGFVFLTGAAVLPLLAPIGIQFAIFGILIVGAGVMTLAWYIYSD